MKGAGVPVIPGSKEIIDSVGHGQNIAVDLSYPVMIKASNGDDGRGMRTI